MQREENIILINLNRLQKTAVHIEHNTNKGDD